MVEKIKHSLESFYIIDSFKKHKKLKSKVLAAINKAKSSKLEMKDTYYADSINRLDWLEAKNFKRPWLKTIYKDLHDFLNQKLLEAGYEGCQIKEIWFQQYNTKGTHGWHVHSGTFTGAYYLDLPEGAPLTEIIDPYDHSRKIKLNVKEGDVSIFPTYSIHRSPENNIEKQKTIISFNIEISKPTKQVLDTINQTSVMHTHCKDYLYSVKLNTIDNNKLVEYSLEVEQLLKRNLPKIDLNWYGTFTTASHGKYNFLTFPNFEINKLYKELVKNITPLLEDRSYMIKSWVNVFRKGEKVDWHNHWPAYKKVWHGFYCLQVGDSYTEYKIPNVKEIVKVPSQEGLLVVGKSEDDQHRSSPWNEEQRPRITVAFDIVPTDSIDNPLRVNHFIPFKI